MAVIVDKARDLLFADAGFPGDQHRDILGRSGCGQYLDVLDLVALADDRVIGKQFAQRVSLIPDRLATFRLGDRDNGQLRNSFKVPALLRLEAAFIPVTFPTGTALQIDDAPQPSRDHQWSAHDRRDGVADQCPALLIYVLKHSAAQRKLGRTIKTPFPVNRGNEVVLVWTDP